MFKQASVKQIRAQEVPRQNTHLVIAMRHYPRGVRKELSDEFRSDLAPAPELFKEWKAMEREHGHDEAFRMTKYEERFVVSPIALYHLKQLSERAKN